VLLRGLVEFRRRLILRKGTTVILAFFWISGLISGFLLFYQSAASASLMRGCVYASVSIVWFLVLSILPFLFSALAVFLSFPPLLFLACFLKALCHGFLLAGLDSVWGSAVWLVRLLVLSDDFILVPLLYYFWLRCISRVKNSIFLESLVTCSCGILVIIGINRLIIPFFAEIFIL